jgi:hypothetical protein
LAEAQKVKNVCVMKILLGCEVTQVVLKEMLLRGHDAYSCDTQPAGGGIPERHLQMDIYEALNYKNWDMGIFFTPCTFSCNSGVRWLVNKDKSINEERMKGVVKYAGMLRDCLNSYIPMVACENPIPHRFALDIIGRKYNQIIQPWQFGHGEQKATCLWLKELPLLKPTEIVEGREQRIWKMPPGENRSNERSKTFTGIAKAMAEQWG